MLLAAACEPVPAPGPAPTAGAGDEPIAVYFTEPGTGGDSRALEQALLASIGAAQASIDVAMYNFSLRSAADALAEAAGRGVRVRVVMDSDALDSAVVPRLRKAGIGVLGDGREGLMHNKFLVIDGAVVWTGSLNLTSTGLSLDHNNFVRIRSSELAALYAAEFNEMYVDGRFGGGSTPAGGTGWLEVGGAQVQALFSPDDSPSRRLVELVNGAQRSVDFLAYTLTLNGLGEALLDAPGRDAAVRGVIEGENADAAGSEYAALRKAGLDVRLDGAEGLMHEKVLILDGETVAFGSYNFTRSADENNDENILIVRDAQIARLFLEEFERIYSAGR